MQFTRSSGWTIYITQWTLALKKHLHYWVSHGFDPQTFWGQWPRWMTLATFLEATHLTRPRISWPASGQSFEQFALNTSCGPTWTPRRKTFTNVYLCFCTGTRVSPTRRVEFWWCHFKVPLAGVHPNGVERWKKTTGPWEKVFHWISSRLDSKHVCWSTWSRRSIWGQCCWVLMG